MILQWIAFNNKINYVLSNDIKTPRLEETLMKRVKMISAYEELEWDGAEIKTFGSTDQGVSFLVRADGLNIFHAGDMNCGTGVTIRKRKGDAPNAVLKRKLQS